MNNIPEFFCGYCMLCKELKDDDFGQWHIENQGSYHEKIEITRGCRDCGRTLTTIETLQEILPEFLQEVLDEQIENN